MAESPLAALVEMHHWKEGGERVLGGFQLGEHWIEPAANEIDGKRVDGKSIDVLVALVEAAPRVMSVPGLLERVWSGTVVVDNVVHQAIAKLRRALGDNARAPRYIQSIPNRGYRLVAEVRTGPASKAPPSRERSIAVLPFLNMSSDIEQAYFSDGISEELLTLLSRIPRLRVPSRSTVFSYKGKDVKLAEVARELNVSHVLEGSVRKSGDRVRVTAQLIDAVTDTHLWSETYDRRFEDIFSIQEEIAATIAQQLKVKLFGNVPTVVKTDPDAYAMFLQARQLIYQAGAQNLADSVALLERVLAIDPNYAPAWAELGWNYRNQTDGKLIREHEGYPRARAALERALQLDPDIPQAHAHLGSIARTYEGNLAVAARHLERAVSLDSSQLGFIADAGMLMRSLGRLDAAIELQEYVLARDPAFRFVPRSLGASYVDAGRWDEAIASFRAMRGLRGDTPLLDYRIAMALLLKGDVEGALGVVERDSDPVGRLLGTCLVRHALGEASASRVALDTVIEQHGEAWSYHIASMLAFRGEVDGSFEWLAKTAQHYRVDLSFITTDRLLRNLHHDSRWLPFLESIGKSPAQLSAVEFKVVLPQ
jgi:TolB-like protein